MSPHRSTRFCFLGVAKVKSEKVLSPLYLHPPSLFMVVVGTVAKIFGIDAGKTLMNMEMLKFLRASSDTRLYLRYQSDCAFHLPVVL